MTKTQGHGWWCWKYPPVDISGIPSKILQIFLQNIYISIGDLKTLCPKCPPGEIFESINRFLSDSEGDALVLRRRQYRPTSSFARSSTDEELTSSDCTSDSDNSKVDSNSNVKSNPSLALIVRPKTLFEKWQWHIGGIWSGSWPFCI